MPSTSVDRSEQTSGVAEGQDLLRDASILIVDDCTLHRENLAAIVAANGTAAPSVAWDLPSLARALKDTTPSVILLNMATRDHEMLLRTVLEISPNVRVIVVGLSEDDESEIVACAEAGVAGYHLRTESLDDLLVLIRRVAAGESLCSPRVSAILLRRLSALASQRQPAARGTRSYGARGPDPADAGNGPVESGYRSAAVHLGSYGQEPRAQRVDQAWRQLTRRSGGILPHRPVHRREHRN